MGVPRLIQMSSLAADLASPSVWAKTKAEGEIAAVENFPGATIVRAAPIFGFRDRLTNWNATTASNGLGLGLGGLGIPLVDGGQARIAPVSVVDVAKVIKVIAHDDQYQGKLLELAGQYFRVHFNCTEDPPPVIIFGSPTLIISNTSPFIKRYL